MTIIKNSKELTTLEVGDKIMFGNIEYIVRDVFNLDSTQSYYLHYPTGYNDFIFETLKLNKKDFIEKLGIDANCYYAFPETKSLEALTAIVSALFREYEKQNELPKTWEEFCKRNPVTSGEGYISIGSGIRETYTNTRERDSVLDKNLCTSPQEAKAFVALMQLRQLRKVYVKDWEPNGTKHYWGIYLTHSGNIHIDDTTIHLKVLSFPTYRLAVQFATNFKNLLEIAKPLL